MPPPWPVYLPPIRHRAETSRCQMPKPRHLDFWQEMRRVLTAGLDSIGGATYTFDPNNRRGASNNRLQRNDYLPICRLTMFSC